MVVYARILLRMELLKNLFFLYETGKLCSKFGEDRSIHNATIVPNDAGRTDGRLRDFLYCPMSDIHIHLCFCCSVVSMIHLVSLQYFWITDICFPTKLSQLFPQPHFKHFNPFDIFYTLFTSLLHTKPHSTPTADVNLHQLFSGFTRERCQPICIGVNPPAPRYRQMQLCENARSCQLTSLYAIQITSFLLGVSIAACYAMSCLSYRKGVRPSVHVSVCHTLLPYQNDTS